MPVEQNNARHPEESLAVARNEAGVLTSQIPQFKIHDSKLTIPPVMIDFSAKLRYFSFFSKICTFSLFIFIFFLDSHRKYVLILHNFKLVRQ